MSSFHLFRHPKRSVSVLVGLALLLSAALTRAQEAAPDFYFGVDLSYANEMEDCGAIYREQGQPRDVYDLFAEQGATLVRARLWHTPTWTQYSTLDDVKRTFTRAKVQGMAALLDIHYSDDWADAGHQSIPSAWQGLSDDDLVTAVYDYTTEVMMDLYEADLMPAFVQIGNETNSGILKRDGQSTWPRDALLFQSGIRAVRDVATKTNTHPRVMLHVAQPENTTWWFTEAEKQGLTDFDVIGISYYPQWSTFSIADMGAQVTFLRQRFGKDVMVLETAYPWTRNDVDSADNLLTEGVRAYPFSPQGQHQFMLDLTQSLISNGAIGVVYWEPAWVSTDCKTRWGQGSHWDNATFFDAANNNEMLEGIQFLHDGYLHPSLRPDGVIEAEYGEPRLVDDTGDVMGDRSALDLAALSLRSDETTLSLAISISGDISAYRGGYLVYIDTTQDEQGADVDAGKRPITVADPYKPEFRLDVTITDAGADYVLHTWTGSAWEDAAFTGGAAIHAGTPSVIELTLPLSLLQAADHINVAVVSVPRGRVQTAADVLGSSAGPAASDEPIILETFATYQP